MLPLMGGKGEWEPDIDRVLTVLSQTKSIKYQNQREITNQNL